MHSRLGGEIVERQQGVAVPGQVLGGRIAFPLVGIERTSKTDSAVTLATIQESFGRHSGMTEL